MLKSFMVHLGFRGVGVNGIQGKSAGDVRISVKVG